MKSLKERSRWCIANRSWENVYTGNRKKPLDPDWFRKEIDKIREKKIKERLDTCQIT